MVIRATVLLVCLIAVPLIAICGKSAPEYVKSLIRNYTGSTEKAASPNPVSTDAPVFRPGLLAATAGSPLPESAAPARLPVGDPAAPGRLAAGSSNRGQVKEVTTISHQVDSPTGTERPADHSASSDLDLRDSKREHFPRDYFRTAETRLRDLGATYYLLETLGPAGDQYRFVCKVASAGQPEQTLAFFAIDRDPLAAMNHVVRQVESWRSHLHQ
jgi:hypothetical protein